MTYQPKSYRKFLATSVAAAMVATVPAGFVGAEAADASFTDVVAGSYYEEAVNKMAEAEMVNGVGGGLFGTNSELLRRDAAVLFANSLLWDTEGVEASAFTDVPAGKYYTDAISKAVELGVINGKSATTFAPNDKLTRGEMAVLLTRALGLTVDATVEVPFTDIDGHPYAEQIKAVYQAGLTQGATATTFDASGTVTRAQFATFLYRSETVQENVATEIAKKTTPAVKSVSAINAKQVVVKFNQSVDKTDAEDFTNYTINGTAATAATLDADGMTVTLTFSSAEATDAILVIDPVKTTRDATVTTEKYTQVYNYTDILRPSVTTVTYENYYTAKISFSEPIKTEGSISFSDANAVYSFTPGDDYITVDLSAAAADTNITVTVVGATDYSDNLVSPNPVTCNLKKVKTDTVKPEVSTVTVKDTTRFTVQFTEALQSAPTIRVGGTDVSTILGTTVTQDTNDKTKWNVVLGAAQSGVQVVAVDAGYLDISANAGAAFSKLVEFKADTTAPAYVSHEVKTISGTQYLVVKFNEELSAAAGSVTGTYLDANQVTYAATLGTASLHDSDADGVNDAVKVSLASNNPGSYSVTLPVGLGQDTATNTSAAKSVSFTLGSTSDSSKPGISSVVVSGSTVTVSYSEPVSASSALNLANYRVEGVNVFSSAIFDGNQQTVKLTLQDGVITVDGLRSFTIANVADVNGNVMDAYSSQQSFDENVKPVISSAVLTGANEVTVTFSEAMDAATLTDGTADFNVKVEGTNNAVTGTVYDASTKELTLTFTTALTDLSDTVTLDVLVGNNVVDANANSLATSGTITVSK